MKPGEPHTVWLDLRDRILPRGVGLYLVIAGAGADFGPASLEGAEVRLVFKPAAAAKAEHVLDRFTQVRDNFAHIIEERPNTRRLNLYTRFETDLHRPARASIRSTRARREYWYEYNREQPRPQIALSAPPAGVPLWAFRQVEYLRYVKRFVNWFIDHRQLENGEFGGGLSDDGDLTNWWPGTAMMGVAPGKLKASLLKEMEAFYDQGLFTNGLSTIQTDELHSYEEGIQVLGQAMLLDFGGPAHLERAMETARALEERLTGVNAAGHRHIRSSVLQRHEGRDRRRVGLVEAVLVPGAASRHRAGGLQRRAARPDVAARTGRRPARALQARRQGRPRSSARPCGSRPTRICPRPGQSAPGRCCGPPSGGRAIASTSRPCSTRDRAACGGIAANALDLLRLRNRLAADSDRGGEVPPPIRWLRHLAWQVTGDRTFLEALYQDQIQAAAAREYINTEGSLWTDRASINHAELQRARLGGIALVRNAYVPGQAVSWTFASAGDEERVAILVPDATPTRLRVHRPQHRLDARRRAHDRLGRRARRVGADAGHGPRPGRAARPGGHTAHDPARALRRSRGDLRARRRDGARAGLAHEGHALLVPRRPRDWRARREGRGATPDRDRAQPRRDRHAAGPPRRPRSVGGPRSPGRRCRR